MLLFYIVYWLFIVIKYLKQVKAEVFCTELLYEIEKMWN